MRRFVIYICLFFIFGILIYNSPNYLIISAAFSALFFFFLKKQGASAFFCIIFIFLGMAAAAFHTNLFDRRYEMLSRQELLEGYVVEKNNDLLVVKNYKTGFKVIVSEYGKSALFPGDYIVFKGEVRKKPDYKKRIMNSQGIDAYISSSPEEIRTVEKDSFVMLPVKLKYSIINGLLNIESRGGGFICGLLLGYDDRMQYDDARDFKELGLSHILAVSGFNISIIYYFIKLLSKNLPAALRYVLTIVICFLYTMIAGFEPSIFRAFIMILTLTSAKILGRMNDSLNAVTLSGLIMLCFNSFYIYNIGFILSFTATYGIIMLKDEIKDIIESRLKLLSDEVSITLSAFVSTFPVVIWLGGYVSALSVLINFLIAPFITFATLLGFISILIYSIAGKEVILYPVVYTGMVLVNAVDYISKINILWVPGRPSILFLLLYYLFIMLFFGYIKIKISRQGYKIIYTVLLLSMIFLQLYHPAVLKVHILNVGQGDSIFIETPDRKSILIDTGPRVMDYIAVRDKVIPYIMRCGYKKLDILVLTHLHEDHAGGLEFILNNFKVGRVLTYKKPEKSLYSFTEISAGDSIKAGDLILNVLYPDINSENTSSGNETCLVMDLKFRDFSMLLTSDADKEVMDNLSGNYDVMKVAHHGSMGSFSEKMLDSSKISTAVISVGKNGFGHPSDKLIGEMKRRHIKVYRTDEEGDITIETKGYNYKVLFN